MKKILFASILALTCVSTFAQQYSCSMPMVDEYGYEREKATIVNANSQDAAEMKMYRLYGKAGSTYAQCIPVDDAEFDPNSSYALNDYFDERDYN